MDLYEPQPVEEDGNYTVALPTDAFGFPVGYYYGHQYDDAPLPAIAHPQDPSLIPLPPIPPALMSASSVAVSSEMKSAPANAVTHAPFVNRRKRRLPFSNLLDRISSLESDLHSLTMNSLPIPQLVRSDGTELPAFEPPAVLPLHTDEQVESPSVTGSTVSPNLS